MILDVQFSCPSAERTFSVGHSPGARSAVLPWGSQGLAKCKARRALRCLPLPRLITALCVLTEKFYLPLGIDVKINGCLANYSFPITSCSWERRSLRNGK